MTSALLLRGLAGQWVAQESGTAVSLRGIDAVSGVIAWASGADGTILRTDDGGRTWERCTTPTGASQLDFRAVQAIDKNTALAMSSGAGSASRVYKTDDGCRSWKLVFTNPDAPEGFFDALRILPGRDRDLGRIAELIGDPVRGAFPLFRTDDYGATWTKCNTNPCVPEAKAGETLFAASNSSLIEIRNAALFVTGGSVSRSRTADRRAGYIGGDLPMAHGASAGAFSVAVRRAHVLVAVGGDYLHPDQRQGTCATSNDGGLHWKTCGEPPGGYRSSVAFDPVSRFWIAVGPNGTDVSSDDGRHWTRLKPGLSDPADSDKNWNAISLPFVAGSHGRIGRLRRAALGDGRN